MEIWISITALTISCIALFYTVYVRSAQQQLNSTILKSDLLTKTLAVKILFMRLTGDFDSLVSDLHETKSMYVDSCCESTDSASDMTEENLQAIDEIIKVAEVGQKDTANTLTTITHSYEGLLALKSSDENKLEEIRRSVEAVMELGEALDKSLTLSQEGRRSVKAFLLELTDGGRSA